MAEAQLPGNAWGGQGLAIAGPDLGLKAYFKGDQTGFAARGVDIAAGAVFTGSHVGIGADRIAPLHHKRHRFPYDAVEDGAVVDPAFDKIHEIACRQRGSLAV